MINPYANSNHAVHRRNDGLAKHANVYEQQSVSNRTKPNRTIQFSSLAPYQSEAILSKMAQEAEELNGMEIEKKAALAQSPLGLFGNAKQFIASKLGLEEDIAHDLTSSVLTKAQHLQETHGGELETMMSGIIDQIDPAAIESRIGASPMRRSSPQEMEDTVKYSLMEQMQLSSYQADQFKKIVVQQARNLSTSYRQHEVIDIAGAIVRVLVEHQDVSIVYDISSSDRLKNEVEHHLNNA